MHTGSFNLINLKLHSKLISPSRTCRLLSRDSPFCTCGYLADYPQFPHFGVQGAAAHFQCLGRRRAVPVVFFEHV